MSTTLAIAMSGGVDSSAAACLLRSRVCAGGTDHEALLRTGPDLA